MLRIEIGLMRSHKKNGFEEGLPQAIGLRAERRQCLISQKPLKREGKTWGPSAREKKRRLLSRVEKGGETLPDGC